MANSTKSTAARQPKKATKPVEEVVEPVIEEVMSLPAEEVTVEFPEIEEVVEPVIEEQPAEVAETIPEEVVTPDPVEDEIIEEKTVAVAPKSTGKAGKYYIVKLNKFLSKDLSKYAVRIDTNTGVKELVKSSRAKAHKIASELNKAHFNTEEVFVEE